MAVMTVTIALSLAFCYQVWKAESYARYGGIRNISTEKIARIIRGVEMNALNVFDEVCHHMTTADDVIEALKNKASLNPDTRGYFAAFEANYFPEQGTWFEPYIYQPDVTGFEYRQVGSARHNYTKSPWYIRAKETKEVFWSEPYYYYDGTSMSGHYCTFIKPVLGDKGELICVCGADMKFEWLAKELEWIDEDNKGNSLLNKYHLIDEFDFYTIILNNDGTSITHPDDKILEINSKEILQNLKQRKKGVTDTNVNGEACTLYYGPLDYVNWSLAIVVPKQEFWKPMFPIAAILLFSAIIGMIVVWLVCRKVFLTTPRKQNH